MFSLLLAAALPFVFTERDAAIAFQNARTLVETCTPRDAGTSGGRLAAQCIEKFATSAGLTVRRESFRAKTPRGERDFTNLTAELSDGSNDGWVVLVSHYDTKTGVDCPGANDGASTSGLLAGLAQALTRNGKARGNVMFVWTDGEECFDSYGPDDGLWGSKNLAERFVREGRDVRAVICLDMLGDRDLAITVPRNSTPSLVTSVIEAARRAGLAGLVKRGDSGVIDDHVPFLEKGFPAIDLIDFRYGSTPDGNEYWHTSEDTVDKISEKSLLKVGRIVVELLDILLSAPCTTSYN